MDVNGYERLLNITLRHKFNLRNNTVIAVLHFTVTVWSSTKLNVKWPLACD